MSTTFCVVGGTTFDLLAHGLPYLPQVDAAGDEFTQRSLAHLPSGFAPSVGGNAGNAAFVAARMGGRTVQLVTALGEDLFGDWLRERFNDVGIDLVRVPPGETSVNVVATDTAGRRTSLFRPVRVDTEATVTQATAATLRSADVVLLAGYPHPSPEAIAAWAWAGRSPGATVALDPGPAIAGLTVESLHDALAHIDILLANDRELRVLVPGVDPSVAARHLADRYGTAVVVKAGDRGVTYLAGDGETHVPSFRAQRTGPTVGAGDAFNAGFLCRLQDGATPADALRFGAAVAAAVVEGGRGVLGAPNRQQTEAFARSREPATVADAGPGDEAGHRTRRNPTEDRHEPNAKE